MLGVALDWIELRDFLPTSRDGADWGDPRLRRSALASEAATAPSMRFFMLASASMNAASGSTEDRSRKPADAAMRPKTGPTPRALP